MEFIIIAVIAVLVSSILEQVIPKVSSPLIQIGLGVIIALLAWNPIHISLDPEFFLLLFVAPLLFQDARHADKAALWTNRYKIVSLAVGLVIAIMLIVGFTLHIMEPSVPLAVAFALGAALGPTDAVAVLSLKKSVNLTRKENALLSGEALINDASGVVGFQFAIGAAVTGTWTVLSAGLNFLVLFFGGIILGIVLALLIVGIQTGIRNMGLESITFFVLLELLAPFAIYIIAEELHVSGILAVVAAGLLVGYLNEHMSGPNIARLNITSNSVWEVLLYGLNGTVFVMLGLMLPASMDIITEHGIDIAFMIGLCFAITAALFIVRLAWFLVIMHVERDPKTHERIPFTMERWFSSLATTIAGPKGCVTLSIILSMPYTVLDGSAPLAGRDEVIFLACGVILLTLLLANFTLPILAPATTSKAEDEYERSAQIRIEILRNTITELNARKTSENAAATRAVIRTYRGRIERIMNHMDTEASNERDIALSKDILRFQEDLLDAIMDDPNSEFDDAACVRYAQNLARREELLTGHKSGRWVVRSAKRHMRKFIYGIYLAFHQSLPEFEGNPFESYRRIQLHTETETVRFLEKMYETGKHDPETITSAIARHQRNKVNLSDQGPSVSRATRVVDNMGEIMEKGYRIEISQIQEMYEAGRISRPLGVKLRENVILMMIDRKDAI